LWCFSPKYPIVFFSLVSRTIVIFILMNRLIVHWHIYIPPDTMTRKLHKPDTLLRFIFETVCVYGRYTVRKLPEYSPKNTLWIMVGKKRTWKISRLKNTTGYNAYRKNAMSISSCSRWKAGTSVEIKYWFDPIIGCPQIFFR
jgi:hypothetical protein